METNRKRTKSGGRTKGTPNKTTQSVRNFLQSIFDENRAQILDDFQKLDGIDRLNIIVKILPYIAPKMATIETTIKTDEFTDEQITSVAERILSTIDN